jgi:seryl-tRNA synthetase
MTKIKKHFKNISAVDELLQLDEEKRKAQVATESNAAEANQLAKKIGELMKVGTKFDDLRMNIEKSL